MKYAILYMGLINILTFCVFGIDKKRAIQGAWRVRERSLFLLAILGGSPGAIAGMCYFRHKTRKFYFVAGMPVILTLQIVGLMLAIR